MQRRSSQTTSSVRAQLSLALRGAPLADSAPLAAALALTTLYRSSRRTSKRAYNAGYATACQDLLLMIQQGVSTGESTDSDGPGMTIGRIMDYIEARLDAIKSREEEEDEDEEKDRERDRAKPAAGPSAPARVVSLPAAAPPRHKDLVSAIHPCAHRPERA